MGCPHLSRFAGGLLVRVGLESHNMPDQLRHSHLRVFFRQRSLRHESEYGFVGFLWFEWFLWFLWQCGEHILRELWILGQYGQ